MKCYAFKIYTYFHFFFKDTWFIEHCNLSGGDCGRVGGGDGVGPSGGLLLTKKPEYFKVKFSESKEEPVVKIYKRKKLCFILVEILFSYFFLISP